MTFKTLLGTALLTGLIAGPAAAADLTVAVEKIRNSKGKVLIALFDSEQAFKKQDANAAFASFSFPASKKGIKLTLHSLPVGRYAIGLFHDENNNGALDVNKRMFPFEGFAYSNNVAPKKDMTSFDEASFSVQKEVSKQTINLIYLK